MWVDTQCSVIISDFNDEGCSSDTHDITIPVSTDDRQRETSQSDSTVAIVGGVVTVTIVLIVTVGVVVVVALVARSRRGQLPIEKVEA